MRKAIVNVAVSSWYPAGQRRLGASIKEFGGKEFSGGVEPIFWTDAFPPRSPVHSNIPYAFKPHAIRAAYEQGCDYVLWLDASMYLIRPIDPIFDHIEQHGIATWRAGWTVAEWAHDTALTQLGLTRDGASQIPLLCGGICGFNMRMGWVSALVDQWMMYGDDGVTFPGPYDNKNHSCSADPRCLGHRHDMPSLSTLCYRAGVEPISGKWFCYAVQNPGDDILIMARGM